MNKVLKQTKRFVILLVGATLVLIGLALLVLPGPGIVVVIAGLAVLATEFVWAQQLLEKAKESAKRAKNKVAQKARSRKGSRSDADEMLE